MKILLIYENKKAKLLNIIRIGINPFKKFVSTGEIKEELGFVQSRQHILDSIQNLLENNENFILPIIGPVGIGKTHLFWARKQKLTISNTLYLSLENIYRKFFYNLYSEYMEEMGVGVLRYITNKLCEEWGALERKFGFFQVADIKKVRKNAFEKLSVTFEDKIALNDVINAITAHQLDPYKKAESENWLLGELMDFKDLSHLDLLYDLRHKNYAYTILKIIIENTKLGCTLFIDDFEKLISLMKVEKESEDIFEPSWLYENDSDSPESIAAQKILNKIIKLQKIKGLRIIITLKSIKYLEEIKKIVKEKDEILSVNFKEPIILSEFTENDIYEFYRETMKLFLKNVNYLKFYEEFPDSYFPLNEKILRSVYESTFGNPREIIKSLIKIFNEIIYSNEGIEEILNHYEI